ncbi:MAG: hypothetical protein Fur0034_21780 [Desulfuromonadia bacterium]
MGHAGVPTLIPPGLPWLTRQEWLKNHAMGVSFVYTGIPPVVLTGESGKIQVN